MFPFEISISHVIKVILPSNPTLELQDVHRTDSDFFGELAATASFVGENGVTAEVHSNLCTGTEGIELAVGLSLL